MLQNIHDKSKGWLMYIIVGLLVVVFAMWGIGYYLRGSVGPHANAAKVNGVSITHYQLNKSYQNLRSEHKGALSDTQIAALKKQAMQDLIKNAALYSAANDMDMGISNQTIDAWISESPAFQEDGKFSQQKFNYALQSMGLNTEMLRNNIRQNVMTAQVEKGIEKTSFALPNEVKTYQALLGEKRVASYVIVHASQFASNVKVSDSAILAYYNAHKRAFFTPRKVKIAYIELSQKAIENSLKNVPGAQRAAAAQSKYAELGQKLANLTFENPDSLSYTANKLGLKVKTTDYVSEKGGTGHIAGNAQVVKAAFSDDVLKNGNNSDVINLSESDAVVVRVADLKKASPKPLAEVRQQIKQILITQQAAKIAAKKANEMVQAGKLNPSAGQYVASKTYARSAKDLPIPILNALFLQNQVGAHGHFSVVKLKDGYAALNYQKTVLPKVSAPSAFSGSLLAGLLSKTSYTNYVNHLIQTADIKQE